MLSGSRNKTTIYGTIYIRPSEMSLISYMLDQCIVYIGKYRALSREVTCNFRLL